MFQKSNFLASWWGLFLVLGVHFWGGWGGYPPRGGPFLVVWGSIFGGGPKGQKNPIFPFLSKAILVSLFGFLDAANQAPRKSRSFLWHLRKNGQKWGFLGFFGFFGFFGIFGRFLDPPRGGYLFGDPPDHQKWSPQSEVSGVKDTMGRC